MEAGQIALIVGVVLLIILVLSSVKTVAQGSVAVTTVFGKCGQSEM